MRLRNRDVFSLRSPYAPAAVLGLLRGCTATGRGGGDGEDPVLFTGDLPYGGKTFVLRPVCHGRNSWLPVLRCALAPEGSGSLLRVDAQCWRVTRGVYDGVVCHAGTYYIDGSDSAAFGWL